MQQENSGGDKSGSGPRGERIAKRLARAGIASRRDAERLVTAGRVAVDGKVLASPATVVSADAAITVDGEPLPETPATRLWRYHKPPGLVTTARDPQGRPTVFDALPPELGRVISIGRLDLSSEGLLLLSNDGALARHLELPATGWTRRYRVRVHGQVASAALRSLEKGVEVEGVAYGPVQARLERQQGGNAWLLMALKEGRNREVRKLCAHLGLAVNRLIRIAYGPFQLGELPRGAVSEIPARVLREQLGRAAGQFRLPEAVRSERRPTRSQNNAHRRRRS